MSCLNIAALLQAAEYLAQRDNDATTDDNYNVPQQERSAGHGVIVRATNKAAGVVVPSTSGAVRYLHHHRRHDWAEHGYASTMPMPEEARVPSVNVSGKHHLKPKLKKSLGSRTSHNELEKNRRAHLRVCLEKLKDIVPLGNESSRHTTLGLLKKAKKFIETLEDKEHKNTQYKDQLSREHRYLKRRLEQLGDGGRYSCDDAASKRRSVSECSTSTASSSSSSSSSSSGHSSVLHSSIPSPVSESDEVDVIGYTSTHSDTDDLASLRSGTSGHRAMTLSTSRLTISEINVI